MTNAAEKKFMFKEKKKFRLETYLEI